MAVKKSDSKKETKRGPNVKRVLSHAKESLRLFERMERQAIGSAKRLMRVSLVPNSVRKRRSADAKLLLKLKELGIATVSDLQALKDRVARLEAALPEVAPTPLGNGEHTSAVPRA